MAEILINRERQQGCGCIEKRPQGHSKKVANSEPRRKVSREANSARTLFWTSGL